MEVIGDIIITTDSSFDSKNFYVVHIHSIGIQCYEAAIGFQRYLWNSSFFFLVAVHIVAAGSSAVRRRPSLSANNLIKRIIHTYRTYSCKVPDNLREGYWCIQEVSLIDGSTDPLSLEGYRYRTDTTGISSPAVTIDISSWCYFFKTTSCFLWPDDRWSTL